MLKVARGKGSGPMEGEMCTGTNKTSEREPLAGKQRCQICGSSLG